MKTLSNTKIIEKLYYIMEIIGYYIGYVIARILNYIK
jgi:hypothetical protein